MSDLPPKADIAEGCCYVRFVPKADIGYSINSSARSCSSREIVSPIASAVLRLITSLKTVPCSTSPFAWRQRACGSSVRR